jgi:membrane protease YdiL (CAAX protease family)
MAAMPKPLGREARVRLAAALGVGWLLLGLGAWVYARMKDIPAWAAVPLAAAFLLEIPFYLSPGFDGPRAWLAGIGKARAAALLTVSAVSPWLVYSLPTGHASAAQFLDLLAIVLGVGFWYVLLPAAPVADALFLAALVAIYLSKVFDSIYVSPVSGLSISALGHLMLIRLAAMALLVVRGNVKAEFRFLPNRGEWLTGLRYFAFTLPVVGFTYWALGLVRWRPQPLNILQALGIFLGILWVVALSEEFFFRGLLQQWLERWTGSAFTALVVAAVLFGSAHLGFHRIFPNWRWAIVAGILGIFCGLAWKRSRSVQASMVTHALIVTVWEVFLR